MAKQKFEENEKEIAQAENVLIENGKYVSTDYEENHKLHIEAHLKGSDNMLMKKHIESHQNELRMKIQDKLHMVEIESDFLY